MRALKAQRDSRGAIRGAVRRYAALRQATGTHADTFPVTLRDGTTAVAILTLDLVPDPTQERTP